MLQALADALDDAVSTEAGGELSVTALITALDLSHRPTFRESHLNPAIAEAGSRRHSPTRRAARPNVTG